jgi:hypothetical protein
MRPAPLCYPPRQRQAHRPGQANMCSTAQGMGMHVHRRRLSLSGRPHAACLLTSRTPHHTGALFVQQYTECLSSHQADPEVCMPEYDAFFQCADGILRCVVYAGPRGPHTPMTREAQASA